MNQPRAEDLLGPPRVDIVSVGIAGLASFGAGALGGMFILVCIFLFLSGAQDAAPAIFPYMLSLVALVAILISLFLQFYFSRLIFPDKYSNSGPQSMQTFGFCLLMYILFTPLYVYVGGAKTEMLMIVFAMHVLIASLGSTILVEVVSQYRYSLLAIYSSFVGSFVAGSLVVIFFMGSSTSQKILFSLSAIIAITLVVQTLCKTLFEFIYFKLYQITGQDVLGDVFSQMQRDELEEVEAATKTLTTFQ